MGDHHLCPVHPLMPDLRQRLTLLTSDSDSHTAVSEHEARGQTHANSLRRYFTHVMYSPMSPYSIMPSDLTHLR